jgi:hypothetical protein
MQGRKKHKRKEPKKKSRLENNMGKTAARTASAEIYSSPSKTN